jgi:hypothetical protein
MFIRARSCSDFAADPFLLTFDSLLNYNLRYDVYTPTRNIVFHDYGIQANGHGENEWFQRQRDRFRQSSIARVKTILQMPGGETDELDRANLGIYGLGKRRSLQQLSEFVNVDLQNRKGNVGANLKCTGHEWVPYDFETSPTDNLYVSPDNLDPQPEYPLRTKLVYYQQVTQPFYEIEDGDVAAAAATLDRRLPLIRNSDGFADNSLATTTNMPPISVLLVFWLFGLLVWYIMFMLPYNNGGGSSGSYNRHHARGRKKSPHLHKNV